MTTLRRFRISINFTNNKLKLNYLFYEKKIRVDTILTVSMQCHAIVTSIDTINNDKLRDDISIQSKISGLAHHNLRNTT